MSFIQTRQLLLATLLISQIILVACGGGGGSGSNSTEGTNNGSTNTTPPSNSARFEFICDLNGVDAILTMDVDVVSDSGIVFGPGSSPDITGVVATGDVTYYTEGSVVSPYTSYAFTGENSYADFYNENTYERFRVQWLSDSENLIMLINPFGYEPTTHTCTPESATYL